MQLNDLRPLMRRPSTRSIFNPEILLEYQEPGPAKVGRKPSRRALLAEAIGVDDQRTVGYWRLDEPQTVDAWLLRLKMAQQARRKTA